MEKNPEPQIVEQANVQYILVDSTQVTMQTRELTPHASNPSGKMTAFR